jgi:acyl-CoA synthetase (AMP-forming)/AMP-acid ligase II
VSADRADAGELGFETVLTAYGLTEATGVVTMCRDGDDAETIATTSGRAIPDVEVRIVDDSGAEVARGEPGEIVVRGYNVTQGYLDDPDATAEAIDADGWLHTGDIGVMDDRGYLDITDRKKDMFIVGGFNAYPAEIENDLSSTRQSRRWRSSACPTSGSARSAVRSWSPRPAATRRSGRAHRLGARAHGQLQGPAPGRGRRRPADQPVGQGPEARAARATRRLIAPRRAPFEETSVGHL